MNGSFEQKTGFTLIELLIVVAIIAILAAIAVPNFLEAQTRAKTSRAKADMRSIATAHQAYRVDYNTDPPPDNVITSDSFSRDWWGFTSHQLTTPVAFLTSIPLDAFPDFSEGSLRYAWPGPDTSIPYAVIIRADAVGSGGPQDWMYLGNSGVSDWPGLTEQQRSDFQRAPAIYVSAGPDDLMTWQYAQVDPVTYPTALYDPTNGTISNGDLFRSIN